MNEISNPLFDLMEQDRRYKPEAYEFIRMALAFAHDVMECGSMSQEDLAEITKDTSGDDIPEEAHLTGQELCEAIRRLALLQFGFMTKTVLNSWGIHETLDFGELVYNMIEVGLMKKSATDSKSDFADVYDFKAAFVEGFEIADVGDIDI
ncbi:MAG: Minf_1886 family protein [Pirellulaceae bacterium]|jgi:uncharacterized repeat protein (TIGR04138 family)